MYVRRLTQLEKEGIEIASMIKGLINSLSKWQPHSAFSFACPVKQPAGLPDEDRGFTGELSAFSFFLLSAPCSRQVAFVVQKRE
jgi:hypothetical protein